MDASGRWRCGDIAAARIGLLANLLSIRTSTSEVHRRVSLVRRQGRQGVPTQSSARGLPTPRAGRKRALAKTAARARKCYTSAVQMIGCGKDAPPADAALSLRRWGTAVRRLPLPAVGWRTAWRREIMMPVYEFHCATCGPFAWWRSMSEAAAPARCPTCDAPATRVYSPPGLVRTPAALSRALARAEKSAHEPEVARRALPGSEASPAPRHQSNAHPWYIGH